MVDRLGAGIWDKALEPKEIRKFVGMEQGSPPPHSTHPPTQTNHPPSSPPAVLLTDGSKGGWRD